MNLVQSSIPRRANGLLVLILAALFVASCGGSGTQTTPSSSSTSIEVVVATTMTSTTVVEVTEPVLDNFRPTALITTTGVPLAVVGVGGPRNLVRTSCGAIQFVSGGVFLTDISVVLDPGHGGPVATGAVGPNGLVESELNLQLVAATVAELQLRGIGAISTRSANYATTLPVRAALGDALGAEMLVSIHHNAPNAFASDSPGTEVFVQSNSLSSERLGGLLHLYVSEALSQFKDVRWSAAGDAGVMHVLNDERSDAYGIVRRPSIPSVIVEMGYISNSDESMLFASSEYLEVAGVALADAIEAYLGSDQEGSPLQLKPRIFNPAAAPSADHCDDPEFE